ncbi:uncharacterized protein LOC134836365 [Culicoides brevitarsis]|uniref:uncharacterized protein LOC134836365 n=1 Tax=Culicoides brevitarsis TaxID=469753 RepID=UPI00307CC70E
MEFDEGLFVDYVKETPIVWDRFSPKFRLKNEKMSAWMNIGSKFGLTGQQAYCKWVSLREKYRREVTYWEEVSIYGTDNPKQKWHLLDAMSFIDAVYKPRTKSTEVPFKRRKNDNNHTGNQFNQLQSLFNSNGFSQNSLLQSMFQMDARDDDVSISPEIIESRSASPETPPPPLSTTTTTIPIKREHEETPNSWNKNKYLSFGKYIGEELCSMKHHEAAELHEALMQSVLEFKRKAKSTKESSNFNGN